MTEVANLIADVFSKTEKYEDMSTWTESGFGHCHENNVKCVIFDGRFTASSDNKEKGPVIKLSGMVGTFGRIYADKEYFSFIITVPQSVWNARKARLQENSLFHDSHILKFRMT